MQKLLKLCSAVSAVALSAAIFAPTAEARLLYTNEDHNIDGDTFVIDFDNDAEGEIALEFGSTNSGAISWNSGALEFTVSDALSVLGDLTISENSDLSGFWNAQMTEVMNGFQSDNLDPLNGNTTSLSGIVYALDKSIDDLENALVPDFTDLISGYDVLNTAEPNTITGIIEEIDTTFNDLLNGNTEIAFDGANDINNASVTNLTGAIAALSGSIDNIENGITDIAFNDTSSGIAEFTDGTLSGTLAEIGKQVAINEFDIFNNQVEITSLTGRVALLEEATNPDFTNVTDFQVLDSQTAGSGTLLSIIDQIDAQLADLDSGTSTVVENVNGQAAVLAQRAEFANAAFFAATDSGYAGFAGGEKSNGTLSLEEVSGDLAYVWDTLSTSGDDQYMDIVVDTTIPESFTGTAATLDLYALGTGNADISLSVDNFVTTYNADTTGIDISSLGLTPGGKLQLTFRLRVQDAGASANLYGYDINYTAAYAK